jgi:integrase
MARGSIEQRSPGTWSIRIELAPDPNNGKRRQKRMTFRGTKRAAERRLTELLREIDSGGFINPSKSTLAEYLKGRIRDYAWPNLAPKTAQNYEHMVMKHLTPGLGAVHLSQLRPEHIQTYLADKLASGLSAKTVRHHYVTLHTALAHAVKHGLLGRNPCDNVTPPKFYQPEMNVLDEEGIHRLLEAARSTEYYPLFYFLLFTGCRRSEALALRWRDVNLLMGQVSINRSLHQLRDGSFVFRQPKTTRSRRLISLPPSASIVLREHYEKQQALRESLGMELAEDDLVFCHYDGQPYLPDTITHYWIKLTRRLRLEGIRLHDARHTHATLMLKDNIHPLDHQRRLGHASITTTIDTYSHLVPEIGQMAAVQFDKGLARRLEPQPAPLEEVKAP